MSFLLKKASIKLQSPAEKAPESASEYRLEIPAFTLRLPFSMASIRSSGEFSFSNVINSTVYRTNENTASIIHGTVVLSRYN